jgi:hypothetical protein
MNKSVVINLGKICDNIVVVTCSEDVAVLEQQVKEAIARAIATASENVKEPNPEIQG